MEESVIQIPSKKELSTLSFTHSTVLCCNIRNGSGVHIVNNSKKSIAYKSILIALLASLPVQKMLKMTTCNIKLSDEKGANGYSWCQELQMSIQGRSATSTMCEILRLVELNQYYLLMMVKMQDGKIVQIECVNKKEIKRAKSTIARTKDIVYPTDIPQEQSQSQIITNSQQLAIAHSPSNTHGVIYIIRTRASINANERVYKIGKTSKSFSTRMGGYDKGYETILVLPVPSCTLDKVEHAVLECIAKHFKRRTDYGVEYFEGDGIEMVKRTLVSCFFLM